MKTIWKLTVTGGALAASLAVLAMNPLKNPKVIQDLGLSPQQVQQLEDLQYQNQKETIDSRHDMALKSLDLQREMDKESPDPKIVDKLIDEIGACRTQMQKGRTHHLLAVKKILTPEQWQKGRAMLMHHREQMREGRGERGGRPGKEGGWSHGGGAGRGMRPAAGEPPEFGQGPGGGGPDAGQAQETPAP